MQHPLVQVVILLLFVLPVSCAERPKNNNKEADSNTANVTAPNETPTSPVASTAPANILLNHHVVEITSSDAYEKHPGPDVLDGDCSTAWSAKVNPKKSPWIEVTFDKPRRINQIRITTGWERTNTKGQDLFMLNMQVQTVTAIFDDTTERKETAVLESRLLVMDTPNITAKKIRFRFDALWPGAKYKDIAISDIIFLGPPSDDDEAEKENSADHLRCDQKLQNEIDTTDDKAPFMSKSAICERLEKRAHLMLDDFDKKITSGSTGKSLLFTRAKNIVSYHSKCHPAGKGAWMLLPFDTSYTVDYLSDVEDDFKFFGKHLIIYIREDGLPLVAPKTFHLDEDAFDHTFDAISELLFIDLNSDGILELIMDRSNDEDGAIFSIWSATVDAVVEYEGLRHIQIQKFVDYDKDGRKDIISFQPWRTDENHWGSTEYDCSIGVPPVLYHGNADGTFTPSDKVAKAYLTEQCKTVSDKPFLLAPDYEWENDVMLRIACARLRGKTKQQVTNQLSEEWRSFTPPKNISWGMSLDDFIKWAAIEPPCTI